jgi:hypothetical protein
MTIIIESGWAIEYIGGGHGGEWYTVRNTWKCGGWEDRKLFRNKVDAIATAWQLRSAGKTVRIVYVRRGRKA